MNQENIIDFGLVQRKHLLTRVERLVKHHNFSSRNYQKIVQSAICSITDLNRCSKMIKEIEDITYYKVGG